MQATGPDQEFELTRQTTVEADFHAGVALLDGRDALTEEALDVIWEGAVDHRRQITARQTGEPAPGHPADAGSGKPAHSVPTAINQSHIAHGISGGLQLRTEGPFARRFDNPHPRSR